MPAKLYRVNLTQDEREHLLGITRRGQSSGRKLKRALILCKADEGLTDQQVAEALLGNCSELRGSEQLAACGEGIQSSGAPGIEAGFDLVQSR